MFNPREFIDDFMALGHSYEDAVAMARDEVSARIRTAKRSGSEVQRKRDAGEEFRPLALNWRTLAERQRIRNERSTAAIGATPGRAHQEVAS